MAVDLELSQGVPYKVFTLNNPKRLVLDFAEVDWAGADKKRFMANGLVSDARFGPFRPGWSRMVLDLAGPFVVHRSHMTLDNTNGSARLRIALIKVGEEEFTQKSTPAKGIILSDTRAKPKRPSNSFVVVLDPGHGGIDPGAERGQSKEKDIVLAFARELRAELRRVDGIQVVLTREDDRFVSLERRVAIAHQVGAHVFISLHADALPQGSAKGATLYRLSKQASDTASALLAERHNRADILSGVDLVGKDDVIADVLMDMARAETEPRTDRLTRALAASLRENRIPLNRRPFRSASFSVLKSADIPSVLLEIGFMSNPRDLKNITTPEWRARAAQGLRDGIVKWMIEDRALKPLVRQ